MDFKHHTRLGPLPAGRPGHQPRIFPRDWLFSHRTRKALIAERIEDVATNSGTRTVLDHQLVDEALCSLVRLAPNASTAIPGMTVGEVGILIYHS